VIDHLQPSPELQEIAQEETAQIAAQAPVRNAQNVASVFVIATAAGADLTGVTDTMTAIRTIRDGVNGGDSFSSTVFPEGLVDKVRAGVSAVHPCAVAATLAHRAMPL
jgi:LDH2 family malate/lactate/ureidoglycolate dehydrogenase